MSGKSVSCLKQNITMSLEAMDRDLQLLRDCSHTVTKRRASPLVFPDMGHIELDLSPWHFKSRYRMSHESFRDLLAELDPLLGDNEIGRPRISKVSRVLATLRYFGTETAKQKVQGDVMGISQPSVSRIVPEVARAIASLSPKYIQWPTAASDIRFSFRPSLRQEERDTLLLHCP